MVTTLETTVNGLVRASFLTKFHNTMLIHTHCLHRSAAQHHFWKSILTCKTIYHWWILAYSTYNMWLIFFFSTLISFHNIAYITNIMHIPCNTDKTFNPCLNSEHTGIVVVLGYRRWGVNWKGLTVQRPSVFHSIPTSAYKVKRSHQSKITYCTAVQWWLRRFAG